MVTGESGAGKSAGPPIISNHLIRFLGKTESTKLMVSHIIHCSGDTTDRELQNRIIEVSIQLLRIFSVRTILF